jgi:DNA helicase HerA-like ATPase
MRVFLGEKNGKIVSIDENTRRKHCTIFGKSGVGKTTLLRNMVLSDLRDDQGFTLIDPRGGLIEDVLRTIPRHRTNDVI